MNAIELLRLGEVDLGLLEWLRARLEAEFRVPCRIHSGNADPEFAFHPERQQYHSSEIVAWLRSGATQDGTRRLAVTGVDLYIPILTYVFGEAEEQGSCAVVSFHRLQQEFYGLPPDEDLLRSRLLREAVHELGHTLGLRHCEDYRCAMSRSATVEWIDIKENSFCALCRQRIAPLVSARAAGSKVFPWKR